MLEVFDMAAKDDLDLGEDKKSTQKWIVIILAATLVLLILAAAGLYFTGRLSFGKSPGTGAEDKAAKKTPSTAAKALHFYEFEPFLVNFPRGEIARLLQINFSILTYDEKTIEALKKHAPMIRNHLLLLLGRYKPEDLQPVQGKEALRQAIAQEIQKVLDRQTEGGSFEAVFFTQFVMQ